VQTAKPVNLRMPIVLTHRSRKYSTLWDTLAEKLDQSTCWAGRKERKVQLSKGAASVQTTRGLKKLLSLGEGRNNRSVENLCCSAEERESSEGRHMKWKHIRRRIIVLTLRLRDFLLLMSTGTSSIRFEKPKRHRDETCINSKVKGQGSRGKNRHSQKES